MPLKIELHVDPVTRIQFKKETIVFFLHYLRTICNFVGIKSAFLFNAVQNRSDTGGVDGKSGTATGTGGKSKDTGLLSNSLLIVIHVCMFLLIFPCLIR